MEKNFFSLCNVLSVVGLHCCMGVFSSCGERGLLSLAVSRLLTVVASLVVKRALSGYSSRALEHRLRSWCTGLVAQQHVGSSGTRDGTQISCIGRQILYH